MRRLLRDHPLAGFLLLTVVISWGVPGLWLAGARLGALPTATFEIYSPLYLLAVWAPALAALVLVGVTTGAAGVRGFLARLAWWRAGRRLGAGWYALVLVGLPLLYLAAALLTARFGLPAFRWPLEAWGPVLAESLRRGATGPLEELGWRGVALPLLQRRMAGWQAALVLGLVWGAWHLPAFLVGTLYEDHTGGGGLAVARAMAVFVLGTVTLSVLLTIVTNAARGGLWPAMLLHWVTNLPFPWEGPAEPRFAQGVLLALVAVALAAGPGRRWLGRRDLAVDVVPPPASPAGRPSTATPRSTRTLVTLLVLVGAVALSGARVAAAQAAAPEAESREPRAESREPRAESREPRAESREPRAESRKPSARSPWSPTPRPPAPPAPSRRSGRRAS